MQRKLLLVALTTIFLSSAVPSYAVQDIDDPSRESQMEMKQKQIKEKTAELRAEIKDKRSDYKIEQKTMRKDFNGSQSAELKAAMLANKEAFRAKIATLRDEQKKVKAESIDVKLAAANQNKTDQMGKALVKLQEILNRLIDKANTAKTAGSDTTEVETAITAAKAAIATAEAALVAQKAKTYTATITDEASLGKSFSTTFTQLRTDLNAVHETIKSAKKAVRDVAVH